MWRESHYERLGEYGFAVDNLRAATIATASGQVVRASAEDNPDLFWAIRGGGCNFGVVTEFELKMHPQRRAVFAGVVAYPGTMEVLRDVMGVMESWWKANPVQESIIQFLTLGPDGNVSLNTLHKSLYTKRTQACVCARALLEWLRGGGSRAL